MITKNMLTFPATMLCYRRFFCLAFVCIVRTANGFVWKNHVFVRVHESRLCGASGRTDSLPRAALEHAVRLLR